MAEGINLGLCCVQIHFVTDSTLTYVPIHMQSWRASSITDTSHIPGILPASGLWDGVPVKEGICSQGPGGQERSSLRKQNL